MVKSHPTELLGGGCVLGGRVSPAEKEESAGSLHITVRMPEEKKNPENKNAGMERTPDQ